jgi:SH3-like domain-containing protein
MRIALALILSVFVLTSSIATRAQVSGSGLPLPRFVSLRAGEVNLRTGPGVQYPVEWVYRKSGLPLEVIAEYKTWRKVSDWQGSQGWVHQTMLSSNRTFIVTGRTRTLLSKKALDSRPIAQLQANVTGQIISCPANTEFCHVEVEGFEGWLARGDFWGVLKGENFE